MEAPGESASAIFQAIEPESKADRDIKQQKRYVSLVTKIFKKSTCGIRYEE
jgi:hypothetical protein